MIAWLDLSHERRQQLLTAVSIRTQLPEYAIEKDWWVTLALKAAFSTPWADYLVFKGGTSLSKAWNLIERFSEDIDLALDRTVLGFAGELSKGDVKRLRRKASEFMSDTFRKDLEQALLDMGLLPEQFQLLVRPTDQPDLDPRVLELHYHSVVTPDPYIENRVLIEIGARSLREPCSPRNIVSIIGATLSGQPFSDFPFPVQTVDPQRTFLEKAFLLHETFYAVPIRKEPNRLTRHLYDLEKLMDTPHAEAALANRELYTSIVLHREKLTAVRGIEYDRHSPDKIDFIPPWDVLSAWESDYTAMKQMIHGPSLPFSELVAKLKELRWRFRKSQPTTLPPEITIADVVAKARERVLEQGNVRDGSFVTMLVYYNQDIMQPESDRNVDHQYKVSFFVSDGRLILDDLVPVPAH